MDAIPFFFLCLGLIIGSFLNVVILRLEKDESLNGRSRCPGCGTKIAWYDNIPLFSFFWLKGKCRACQMAIAWQYPLVELLTGIVFAVLGTLSFDPHGSFFTHFLTVWTLFLASLLIVIAVYDLRTMEIPLVLLMTGAGTTLLVALLRALLSDASLLSLANPGTDMFLGAVIAALFFYALVYFSKETWMGMGDVWLAGILGAAIGVSALFFFLTFSFFLGALIGGLLLTLKKAGMKSHIPFAPFLAVGALVTLILIEIHPYWFSLFLYPYV